MNPFFNADAAAMPDLKPREFLVLAPIAAVVLWMGIYPESFLAPMRRDVTTLLARIDRAAPGSDSGWDRSAVARAVAARPAPVPAAAHGGEAH